MKDCKLKDCCCNCTHQVEINCHPQNLEIGKGSIAETFAWGCECFKVLDCGNQIIFMDTPHGLCELHERKPKL